MDKYLRKFLNNEKVDVFFFNVFKLSYKNVWILFGCLFINNTITVVFNAAGISSQILTVPLSILIAYVLDLTLSRPIHKGLIKLTEHPKNLSPLDKRLYFMIDGWSVFITAVLITFIFSLTNIGPVDSISTVNPFIQLLIWVNIALVVVTIFISLLAEKYQK